MTAQYSIGLLPAMQFSSITADSRTVTSGALFLAYPGLQSDGRDYVSKAVSQGASAVLWDDAAPFNWQSAWQLANVAVPKLKQKAGEIAAEFYAHPSQKLRVIGVTGTNGKTSITQWLGQCLSMLGHKAAVMGTVGNAIIAPTVSSAATHAATHSVCEKPLSFTADISETGNTTPDAVLLQKTLAEYVAENVQTVAMEVSSHGLDQGRVNGVAFDIAVFTNLTRDHLDYHGDMENYGAAKQKLLDWPDLKCAIINIDDAYGANIANTLKAHNKPCLTYGFGDADIKARDLHLSQTGLTMRVETPHGTADISASVIGRFNADNILAVIATLLTLDFSLAEIVTAIAKIAPVAGRMQQIGGGNMPLVVVDYAHTPDALEKILGTLKLQLNVNAKLICVFGCGGNRDAGKRPLMGNIASQYADAVILTNDNPRHEPPAEILQAIQAGFADGFTQYQVEPDRAQAICMAISIAKMGDIVLVAGKGHEDYQEVKGIKTPFSDIAIAREKLNSFDLLNEKLNGFSQTHDLVKNSLADKNLASKGSKQ